MTGSRTHYPWMTLYKAEFRDSAKKLSLEEVGALIMIRTLVDDSDDGWISADDRELSLALRHDVRVAKRLKASLLAKGLLVQEGDRLTHEQSMRQVTSRKTVAEVRSKSGKVGGVQSGKVRAKVLKKHEPDEANGEAKPKLIQKSESEEENLSAPSGAERDSLPNDESARDRAGQRPEGAPAPSALAAEPGSNVVPLVSTPVEVFFRRACVANPEEAKRWLRLHPDVWNVDGASISTNNGFRYDAVMRTFGDLAKQCGVQIMLADLQNPRTA